MTTITISEGDNISVWTEDQTNHPFVIRVRVSSGGTSSTCVGMNMTKLGQFINTLTRIRAEELVRQGKATRRTKPSALPRVENSRLKS